MHSAYGAQMVGQYDDGASATWLSMDVSELYRLGLFLGLPDIGQSRYSPLFLMQAFVCHLQYPRVSQAIAREVMALEGVGPETTTKGPEQLKHAPLNGLWHQHFLMPDAVLQNFGAEWGLSAGGNKRLNGFLYPFFHGHAGEKMDAVSGELTHRLVIEGHERRCRESRMTGEWIVFGKHEELRFYLALATHKQAREAPSSIIEAIRQASGTDFDFLFDR